MKKKAAPAISLRCHSVRLIFSSASLVGWFSSDVARLRRRLPYKSISFYFPIARQRAKMPGVLLALATLNVEDDSQSAAIAAIVPADASA